MDAVRIDKWLWAARFFKTRAMASRACDIGRIQSNSLRAKPAREVHPGDKLRIENERGHLRDRSFSGKRHSRPRRSRADSLSRIRRQPRSALASCGRAQSLGAIRPSSRAPALQARPPAHHSIPPRDLRPDHPDAKKPGTWPGSHAATKSFTRSVSSPSLQSRPGHNSQQPGQQSCHP